MRKLVAFFALLAVFLMSAVHVFAQDRPTLVELLENDADGRFTTLVAAIDAAGLRETLDGEGPFTLLAPTNDAFTAALEGMGMTADEALANTDALTDILMYHVIPGRYFFRNLTSGPTLDTALEGETVTFDLTDGVFTVEGANISDPDNLASNGIMHVIDGVILPPDMRAAPEEATAEPTAEPTAEATTVAAPTRPNLIELLENDADGRFTTLLAAIGAAGLRETLEGEGPFTLLAPSNDAIAASLEAMGMSAEDLLADPEALSSILLYHVIPGRYFFRNLTSGPTLDTALEGEPVTFDLTDGVFTVEGANISDPDNLASNGVMHVIDGVILPPDMRVVPEPEATEVATEAPTAEPTPEATVAPTAEPTSEATTVAAPTRPNLIELLEGDADGRFTTLVAAIDAAGLRETLSSGGPFTLLAPTNDAFTASLEAMDMTAEDVLANPDLLTQVLTYHVIPGRYFFRNLTSGPTLDTLEGDTVTFDLTDGVFTVEGANLSDPDNSASNGVMHVIDSVILPPALRAAPEPEATEVATTEPTPEPTAVVTAEPTPEVTPEPTAEVTPEPTTVAAPERPNLMALLENDADGRFTTLVAAIDAAGLRETLDGEGPFTLLAPTNDAIAALLAQLNLSPEDLLANSDLLTQILTYHVIPGEYFFRNLTSGPTLDTVEGEPVTFDLTDGVFTVAGANLSDPDNVASNGVMHVIDTAILPPSVAAILLNSHIRAGHFSANAGSVDVYINDELSTLTDVVFPTLSDWMNVPAGSYDVGVAPTGSDALVNHLAFDVASGEWVTIAVTGDNALETALYEDFSALDADQARLGVFNGVEASSSYNVVLNGETVITLLGYPGTLGANDGYFTIDVEAGTYTIQVVANNDPTNVIADLGEVTLEAGTNTFVAVVGTTDEPTVLTNVTAVPVE